MKLSKFLAVAVGLAALSALSGGFGRSFCYAQVAEVPVLADADAPNAAEEGNAGNDLTAPLPAGSSAGAYEPTAAERNCTPSAATLKLAENGKARVPIVIAQRAGPETKRAAGELAEFLNRITGATFEVQTPDGLKYDYKPYAGPRKGSKQVLAERQAAAALEAAHALKPAEVLAPTGIVLGTAEEWQIPDELKEGLAMRGVYHGHEAYAIRTQPTRLLLLGAQNRGVVHAVYRLLHELGCRWFATGAHWDVIPQMTDLKFGRDITDRPSIGTRMIAFMDSVKDKEERVDQGNWCRRNGIGASFGSNTGHAWHRIADENNTILLEHPEYFAEVGGKRIVPTTIGKDGKKRINGVFSKFELGNPVVRKMFVDHALNYFRRNPEAEMVSLSPTDGGGFSQSEESRKLGSISDAVYGMVNEVAREVAREFPGKMVGCYAYRETAGPPSFPLESNVYVEVATLFNMSDYSTEQLMEMWPTRVKNMGVYRYFSYYDAGGSDMPGGPISSIEWTRSAIRGDYRHNVAAIFAQSSNAFAMQMRGYLVATRLMWNPEADVDAILADFYDKAYGPAAAPMKRFHERVGRDRKKEINLYVLGAAFRDVDEATRLAKNRPDVLARLSDLKQYLRWTHLRHILAGTPSGTPPLNVKFRENYVAMMRTAAAMAPTYMAQWNMVAKMSGRPHAARLKDISYIISYQRANSQYAKIPGDRKAPNLWDGFTPPTLDSIEADFQASLKLLPTRDIPEREFNLTDLVPVVFPPSPALRSAAPQTNAPAAADASKRREYYQGSTPLYMFYSFQGEPIEVELQAGARGKQGMAKWRLDKPDGKGDWALVTQGEIPTDRTTQTVSIAVSERGLYAFRFRPGSMAGTITYTMDKPATVVASGAKDFKSPFFYVPKGTREIWMSFNHNNGGSQGLLQPDGKEALKLVSGVYTIPVPAGMDGQVWRFAPGSRFRWQHFFNIPNLAAATPEALMVPREVAEKDGLQIRR